MSFISELKGLVNDMLQNVSLLKVKTIRSIGRNPLRIEHDSGGVIQFNADGTIDITGVTSGGVINIVEDLTPQLGGDLDCNGHDITGVTEIHTSTSILFKKV